MFEGTGSFQVRKALLDLKAVLGSFPFSERKVLCEFQRSALGKHGVMVNRANRYRMRILDLDVQPF